MKRFLYVVLVVLSLVLMSVTVFGEQTQDEVSVVYYVGESVVERRLYETGSIISPPQVSCDSGYAVTAWRTSDGAVYDFSVPIGEPIALYADVSLLPAIAYFDDLSFAYDGQTHSLSASVVHHPLENRGGFFTFVWYKNGSIIGESDTVEVKNVADSGEYSVKIGFHIDDDESFIVYDGVTVDITPQSVELPVIEHLIYTGELVSPELSESPLYSFEQVFVKGVGDYQLKLTLRDPENHRWSGESGESTFVSFKVVSPQIVSPENTDSSIAGGEKDDKEFNYGALLFLLSLIFASGALIMIVVARKNTVSACATPKSKAEKSQMHIDEPIETFDDEPELSLQLCESETEYSALDEIDASHANSLISDAMAKSLIKKSDDTFFVSGNRRVEIGIGVINDNFSTNEFVDIDSLIERGLIDDDAGYVTVTEEGAVSKPLKIYANDFTLAAVKMIALSGGEVFRCRSKKY